MVSISACGPFLDCLKDLARRFSVGWRLEDQSGGVWSQFAVLPKRRLDKEVATHTKIALGASSQASNR